MTRFTTSQTLFSDFSIWYLDPITAKQKSQQCNAEDIDRFKVLITKNLIRELTNHLFYNRSKVYAWLEKSNPHHISPRLRKTMSHMQISVTDMYQHEDSKELASHVSIHIIPDLFSKDVAPAKDKPETERYFYLLNELESLTHEILNAELLQKEQKTSKKSEIELAC